ncbi:hypothetical protein HNS38_18680 [Lentimicrobium sp. L6]|uniref:hypothetical protein n=1 Tax=Lentimicrobium sp. L6 TaxID=2735916 RepID=UPI00155569B8|nr:hypothetical protein [Lentimicrobium sp. L6]NPD86795.1 hypothetical protein [Lentimicrobium sp. L6]
MKNKRLKLIIFICVSILLIPLIAMQFTEEVNWSIGDFIVAGVLLLGTGLLFELIIRKVKEPKYRIIIYISILILLFLVWAELAVGIFGTSIGGQ